MDADKDGLPGFYCPEWMKWKPNESHSFQRYEVEDITASSPPMQDDGFLHLNRKPVYEDSKKGNEGQPGTSVLTIVSNKKGKIGFKAVDPNLVKLTDPQLVKRKLETSKSPASKDMKISSGAPPPEKEKPVTEMSTVVWAAKKISQGALMNINEKQSSENAQSKVLDRKRSLPEIIQRAYLPPVYESFHLVDHEQPVQPEKLQEFTTGSNLSELQLQSKAKSLPPSRETTPPASPQASPHLERKTRHRFFSQPDPGVNTRGETEVNASWLTSWFKGNNSSPLDLPSTFQRELSPVTETPETGVFTMERNKFPTSVQKPLLSPQSTMPEMPGAIGIPGQTAEKKSFNKRIVPKASHLREMNTWVPSSM